MKTNKIIFILFAGLSLLSAQSCLKDQADIFEESSSARLISYVENTKDILTGAKNGWIMEYYPGVSQKLGGYVYYLKFNDKEVEARYELKPEDVETSFYKLAFDNSAVLSFDSNNNILHYFATPSSGAYEAKGGDFEFSVMEASPEMVRLKGKRSGNHCDLIPLAEGVDPVEYLTGVKNLSESLCVANVTGKIGSKEVTGEVDLNNRRITFTYEPDEVAEAETKADGEEGEDEEEITVETKSMPFTYTPDGIKAYEPIQIGGCTFQRFYYLAENNLLSNGIFTLTCSLPADYTKYEDFAGKYKFTYNGKSVNVELTATEDKTGYIMSGIMPQYTVRLDYDKAKGRLRWETQVVGSNGNNSIYMAAWDLAHGGNLTWAEGAGVTIYWDEKSQVFKFEDNKAYKDDGFVFDSFLLWETDASGKSVGQWSGWGNGQLPYLDNLKKL